MIDLEFRAWAVQQYRERSLYPMASRRQRTSGEWHRPTSGERTVRGPRRWTGAALSALGQRMQGASGKPVTPLR